MVIVCFSHVNQPKNSVQNPALYVTTDFFFREHITCIFGNNTMPSSDVVAVEINSISKGWVSVSSLGMCLPRAETKLVTMCEGVVLPSKDLAGDS